MPRPRASAPACPMTNAPVCHAPDPPGCFRKRKPLPHTTSVQYRPSTDIGQLLLKEKPLFGIGPAPLYPGDRQEVNCPKGKRDHPGVRRSASRLAMTADIRSPGDVVRLFWGIAIPLPFFYNHIMIYKRRLLYGKYGSRSSCSACAAGHPAM